MAEGMSDTCRQRAEAYLVGGVNSPVRCFQAVDAPPLFISHGRGEMLWDTDGKAYIDLLMSWGALPLGHAHPVVVQAVTQAAGEGSSFGLCSPREGQLAEIICDAVESIQRVRFVNSGTEAVMTAVRLARAITGRKKVLAFEGGYHGHSDGLLAKAGSGLTTLNLPASAGIPAELTAQTLLATYNDLQSVDDLATHWADDLACILVEPVAGNMGVIPPQPGFLEGLRDIADRLGALLIFDEVITGFRVAWGGMQARSGVQSDLTTLGKIIGGGLPVGAIGGRAEFMQRLAPSGDVYQAGTLSGNPLVMAAGVAALTELKRLDPYAQWDDAARDLCQHLAKLADTLGLPIQVQTIGSMFTLFFSDTPVLDHPTSLKACRRSYSRLFNAMLHEGVLLPPSAAEACFLSTAHLSSNTLTSLKTAFANALPACREA